MIGNWVLQNTNLSSVKNILCCLQLRHKHRASTVQHTKRLYMTLISFVELVTPIAADNHRKHCTPGYRQAGPDCTVPTSACYQQKAWPCNRAHHVHALITNYVLTRTEDAEGSVLFNMSGMVLRPIPSPPNPTYPRPLPTLLYRASAKCFAAQACSPPFSTFPTFRTAMQQLHPTSAATHHAPPRMQPLLHHPTLPPQLPILSCHLACLSPQSALSLCTLELHSCHCQGGAPQGLACLGASQ